MAISAAAAAGITAVTAIAGAAVSAYGIMQQQEIASQQAEREAEAQHLQGQLAEENARLQAAEKQKEQQRVASSQVVSGSAAGISLQSTSLLDLMDEASSMFEADRQQLLRTGKIQNEAATYSADSYKLGASRGPSYYQAGATLLNGAGTSMSYGNKAGWFD